MREIVHIQAGQCGNQIGAKVCDRAFSFLGLARFVEAILVIRLRICYIPLVTSLHSNTDVVFKGISNRHV